MGRFINGLMFKNGVSGGKIVKPLPFNTIWGETRKRNGRRIRKIIVGSSFLTTYLHEEIKRLQCLVCRLTTEIDVRNQRMEYTEKRFTQVSTSLGIVTDERNELNQASLQLSTSLSRMTEEREQLNQAHIQEMRNMRSIVYENETLMKDLETHHRELEQQRKEIDKREAQLDLKSKQLSLLSEEVTRKLHTVQKNFEGAEDASSVENVQASTELDDTRKRLEKKDYELDSLSNLNNTLIAKERRSNHELQEAGKVLIEGLDGFGNNGTRPPVIGIRRIGELNDKPFRDICIKKFSTTEWETKSVQLCSLWQNKIQDSGWYPYKHVTVGKKFHRRKTCACMDSLLNNGRCPYREPQVYYTPPAISKGEQLTELIVNPKPSTRVDSKTNISCCGKTPLEMVLIFFISSASPPFSSVLIVSHTQHALNC
ncbi:hypothetical protein C5167_017856 [Papaver somniferum]|uniref:Factor of DNA methylation 1-5/IDN2 domain-containing protein n=1 Tax=Papaver somniferum TaxID=3469 RepID=A0A4Y7INN9_PAPSO|nr:hypothetical protein C5167_017856 [Papaver somniferum]